MKNNLPLQVLSSLSDNQGTYIVDDNGYNIETEWYKNEKIVNTLWKGDENVRKKSN